VRTAAWGVEGGDLLVARPGLLIVGIGQRTTAAAVDALALDSFSDGVGEIIAVELPRERSAMHLDTLLTFVDVDAVIAHPALEELVGGWRLTPSRSGVRVEKLDALLPAVSESLGLPLRVLTADGDALAADRDQWNDAHNVVAVSPGVVLAYDRNERAVETLREAGVEVLATPGSELGRGRGGPRCLSCPIERDDV
jgi:arginine deiminase